MSNNAPINNSPDVFGSQGGNNKAQAGFDVQALFSIVNNATVSAQTKLKDIQSKNSAVSIGDMFEMQLLMNHLSQISEMATSVVSAANTAIASMARNVKG